MFSQRLLILFVLVMLAAVALVYLLRSQSGQPTAVPSEVKSLAVLPLENLSNAPDQEYFSDGMTEALITDLARIRSLRVISRTSVMQYKETREALPQIGRELKVDAILAGSVLRSGDRVRITAHLVHTPTDTYLWAQSYERDLRDVLALQREVARDIARHIQLKLTPEENDHLAGARPVDPAAYEAYLKGRDYWNKRTEEGLEKAIAYFQQAIHIAPDYALAYVGLADSYSLLMPYGNRPARESYLESKAAALKALEIDNTLGEAHASLAVVKHEYEWEHEAAERHYQRAIELNPNYATAHQWYAEFLTRMGRSEEALAEIQRARELDPLSLIVNSIAGWVLHYARQPDQAVRQLQNVLDREPDFIPAHGYLGMAYEQKGLFPQAIVAYQTAFELSGGNPRYLSDLGVVYAKSGNKTEAQKALTELAAIANRTRVQAYHLARVHLALGRTERALQWLEKGYQERGVWMLFLNMDPLFDRLRDEPRFQNLLRRIGLRQSNEDERLGRQLPSS